MDRHTGVWTAIERVELRKGRIFRRRLIYVQVRQDHFIAPVVGGDSTIVADVMPLAIMRVRSRNSPLSGPSSRRFSRNSCLGSHTSSRGGFCTLIRWSIRLRTFLELSHGDRGGQGLGAGLVGIAERAHQVCPQSQFWPRKCDTAGPAADPRVPAR